MKFEPFTIGILPATPDSIAIWFFLCLTLFVNVFLKDRGNQLATKQQRLSDKLAYIVFTILLASSLIAVLLFYWHTNISTPNAIGGFLPISDSGLYFQCAKQILGSGDIASDCRMRPFYSLFLAAVLNLTTLNLQYSFILQTVIVGLSGAFLILSIYRTHGLAASLAGTAATISICSPYVMAVLTENIGLIISLPVIALLWQKHKTLSPLAFAACIFFLVIAQNARPGALIVIPLLIAWYWHVMPGELSIKIKHIIISIASVLLAFFLNSLLADSISDDAHAIHSNFAYTLYGLTAGGKRYLAVMQDHPEIFQRLTGPQINITAEIYRLAWNNFTSQPHLTIIGMIKGIAHYYYELFRFVENSPTRLFLLCLYGAGVLSILRTRKEPDSQLIIAYLIGVTASATVVGFGGGPRIYASTMGFDIILIAIGGMYIAQRLKHMDQIKPTYQVAPSFPLAVFFFLTVIVSVSVTSLYTMREHEDLKATPVSECSQGLVPVVFRPHKGSPVFAIVEQEKKSIFPVQAALDNFQSRIKKWVPKTNELLSLQEGTALILAHQLLEGSSYSRSLLLQFRLAQPLPIGLIKSCVKPFENKGRLGLGEIKSFTVMEK